MAEPMKLEQVLQDELKHLGKHDTLKPDAKGDLKQLHAHVGTLPDGRELSALCFSEGGIRSAAFNPGVLQALAGLKLLGCFDYFSSVSGGGYIAGDESCTSSSRTRPEALPRTSAAPTTKARSPISRPPLSPS